MENIIETIENLNEKLAVLRTDKKKTKNTKEYALAYYHNLQKSRCICVCGKETTFASIYSHRFSKKHLKIMEIKELENRIRSLEENELSKSLDI